MRAALIKNMNLGKSIENPTIDPLVNRLILSRESGDCSEMGELASQKLDYSIFPSNLRCSKLREEIPLLRRISLICFKRRGCENGYREHKFVSI
jgi:hypothetical protein